MAELRRGRGGWTEEVRREEEGRREDRGGKPRRELEFGGMEGPEGKEVPAPFEGGALEDGPEDKEEPPPFGGGTLEDGPGARWPWS